jgi:hypothetical protein
MNIALMDLPIIALKTRSLQRVFPHQWWRLITNEQSLVARMFKAKYHPKGTFLQAKSTSNMSYTWRSILKSRQLLIKGSYWLIGDASQVNIWTDNWLPNQHGFKVWTPKPTTTDYTFVKDLINPITHT